MTNEEYIIPQNVEAEQSVIGAMFFDNKIINDVEKIIQAQDLYRQDNRLIYEAIVNLNNNKIAADIVSVTEELRKKNKLDEIGGIEKITALAVSMPTSANAIYHSKIVREKSILRQIINVADNLERESFKAEITSEKILDKAENQILAIARKKSSCIQPISEIVMDTLADIEKEYNGESLIVGLPTGFKLIDQMTGGLQATDLIIIGGDTSAGKTSLALNITQNVISNPANSVAFFTLEMGKKQLVRRLLFSAAAINQEDLRLGKISKIQFSDMIKMADEMRKSQLMIDVPSGDTIYQIKHTIRDWLKEHALNLIVVDYLQIMQFSNTKRANKEQEMADISRELKLLAIELNIPIIALTQLSNFHLTQQNKRPQIVDVRNSGAIAQNADIVMLLYRNSSIDDDGIETKANVAEINIVKNRNGPIGQVKLHFDPTCTKFENII